MSAEEMSASERIACSVHKARVTAIACVAATFALQACSGGNVISGKSVGAKKHRIVNNSEVSRETILQTHAHLIRREAQSQPDRPADLPSSLHFAPEVDRAELLQFAVRRGKVAWVTGAPAGAFAKLDADRYLLGDHNFARGIQDQSAWSDSQIRRWMEGLLPVCGSASLRTNFPWPAQSRPFLEKAHGRRIGPPEEELLASIGQAPASDDEKATLLCIVTLSSLEFNTR